MLVFVYGTLTDPDRVDAVLDGGYEFVGRAALEGLHRVDGEYPTLSPGGSVEGRLLEVDRAGLERLDAYEGVDRGLYVRVEVPLVGSDEPALTYVGEPERLGVADRTAWPAGPTLHDRVRTYVVREGVTAVPFDE